MQKSLRCIYLSGFRYRFTKNGLTARNVSGAFDREAPDQRCFMFLGAMFLGVGILLVASCYRNRDKPRPDGSLGSYADFTYRSLRCMPVTLPWP